MVTLSQRMAAKNDYPTWSPEPMPETEWHRMLMNLLIDTLAAYYQGQQVCVTGNILVFYEEGDKHKHVSPDVWLARGVEPMLRDNFLIWEEARGPELVIELTSATTADVDRTTKFELYRDVLRVREYFLFDPRDDYLEPRLQGFRLRGDSYQHVHPRNGRLPSQVTGLHLEADGACLRFWNPQTQQWLPSPIEQRDAVIEQQAAEIELLRRQLALRPESNGHT